MNLYLHFVLRLLFCLPIFFWLWYILAPYLLMPIVYVVEVAVIWFFPHSIAGLSVVDSGLVIESIFGAANQQGVVHLNLLPMVYSMPVLVALIAATPVAGRLWCLGFGALWLLPTLLFSVFFNILGVLIQEGGDASRMHFGFSQTAFDAVLSLAQVGLQAVPMAAPLVIWVLLHRKFIVKLAPRLTKAMYATH